jgi:putative copper export protein
MMVSSKHDNAGRLVAVTGGSAAIALGALLMAVHQETAGANTVAKSSNMNVGATTTESAPGATEVTTMAAPAMKGPAALPAEEKGPAAP